jgi:outer membrane protein
MIVRRVEGALGVTAVFVLAACCSCVRTDPWRQHAAAPNAPSALFVGESKSVHTLDPANGQILARDNGKDSAAKPLTLTECVRLALLHNPRTRSSWYSARSAAAAVGETKAGYLPSLEATGSAQQADTVQLDGGTNIEAQSTYETSFSVQYLLFDAGRSARSAGAEAELRQMNSRHNATLQDVALSVEEAYFDFLRSQALRDLARETVKQQESHVALAESRHKAGVARKSDVLKAITEKADAELGRVRAESTMRVAKGRLAHAMGLPIAEPIELAPAPEPQYENTMTDLGALLKDATANRPELQAVMANIDARRAQIEVTQAQDWPKVSAIADYGWKAREFLPDEDEWSAGVAISFPLFSGFGSTYAKQRVEADLERSVAEGETLLRGIELEVWTAYSRLIEARQAIDAAQKLVRAAEESARVAEGEYKAGAGSIIGLIDAQTALTSARTHMIRARLAWHIAVARVERSVGRSLAGARTNEAKGRILP